MVLVDPSRLAARITRSASGLYLRLHRVLDRAWDGEHAVETATGASLRNLDIDSENTDFGDDPLIYVPTPIRAIRRAIEALPLRFEDFAFIDYGSGKGRVLLIASEYPFHRIEGIEFAAELHATATENIKTYRSTTQRCRDISVQLLDAVEYEIPDSPCFLYMYHSFEPPVLRRVLESIQSSYARNPRPIVLLYVNPVYRDVVTEFPFLRLRRRHLRRGLPLPHQVLNYVTSEAAELACC